MGHQVLSICCCKTAPTAALMWFTRMNINRSGTDSGVWEHPGRKVRATLR